MRSARAEGDDPAAPRPGSVPASVTGAPDFESWLVAREPALQRLAHLLAPDSHTAADLVQTTLTKLFLAWPRVSGRGGDVDAYARRVLVNTHHSWWRRAFRRREVSVDAVPDSAPPGSAPEPDREALWAGVVSLPPRQRAVVVLRFYEELTVEETAELLGVSAGTVKSQSSRALATLRDRLPAHLSPAHAPEEES